MCKYQQRMERNIGHGMRLRVAADPGVRVVGEVIRLLEIYIKWCHEHIGENGWQYDGGQGLGHEVKGRRYHVFVGPKPCHWDDSPPYPARIEALVPLLALAQQVKDADGDLEELRELLKARQ